MGVWGVRLGGDRQTDEQKKKRRKIQYCYLRVLLFFHSWMDACEIVNALCVRMCL